MFETKADRAEWRIVYDAAAALEVGDMLTYQALDELLDRSFVNDRTPLYRAMTELERENLRTLDNVPRVGYRVVEASEHERLARRHHRKSRRQLSKSFGKLHSADRSRLTEEERRRVDRLEATVSRHADMIRRIDSRVEQHDAAIKAGRRTTKELEARLDELAERMHRAGIEVPEATP